MEAQRLVALTATSSNLPVGAVAALLSRKSSANVVHHLGDARTIADVTHIGFSFHAKLTNEPTVSSTFSRVRPTAAIATPRFAKASETFAPFHPFRPR
jgi:hypothetical protein